MTVYGYFDWLKPWRIKKRATHSENFSEKTGMHGKSRVSSAINYDCFKLDNPGNCIIRNTWLQCLAQWTQV